MAIDRMAMAKIGHGHQAVGKDRFANEEILATIVLALCGTIVRIIYNMAKITLDNAILASKVLLAENLVPVAVKDSEAMVDFEENVNTIDLIRFVSVSKI